MLHRYQKWPDRFRLTPLNTDKHAAQLFALFHGEGKEFVWDYLRDGPFPSVDRYKEHIETFQCRPDVLPFVVEDVSSGCPVGKLLAIRVDPGDEPAEIAYVVFSPDVHGSGAAIASVCMLADHVFFRLGKTSCRWRCDKRNIKSARFAEKMGFALENEICSDFQVKGHLRDTLVFSLSRDVWLANRFTLISLQRNAVATRLG